ncbi:MAG: hypothetical protein M3Q52_01970 [Pseudomonadota bacterium]|nr:hypothetical protein [Pseudomonadota bacterium]
MGGHIIAILAAAAFAFDYPAAAEPIATEKPGQAAPKVEPKAELNPAELELELAQRGHLTQPAVAPKRPRAARASSCRCGDLASQQR